MNHRLINILVTICFVLEIVSGCKAPLAAKSIWRASNDYGDKPGSGIELALIGKDVMGRFFILDPEKPHDFKSGHAFPIRIVEQRPKELLCEVAFTTSQVDKFILKLPQTFPQDEFIATTSDNGAGAASIAFAFKRVK